PAQFDLLVAIQLHLLAHYIRLYGKFPGAQVDQRGEYDTGRPAIIKELVQGGAHGAPAHDHVVDQDDMAALGLKRQARWPHRRIQTDAGEIIPVKRDIQLAERLLQPQFFVQVIRQPDTAGANSHQDRIRHATLGKQSLQIDRHAIEQLFNIYLGRHGPILSIDLIRHDWAVAFSRPQQLYL